MIETETRQSAGQHAHDSRNGSDALNVCDLLQSLDDLRSLTDHIAEAKFEFRTRLEAKKIALHLASSMPEPISALTGLLEILINAVEHGSLGIGANLKSKLLTEDRLEQEVEARLGDPRYHNRCVTLAFRREAGQYIFKVTDQGDGFDYRAFVDTEDASEARNGRGIMMAQHCFEKLAYSDGGRTVTATIKTG